MARPIPLDIEEPVRSLRNAAGLTQVQLAEAAENAQSTVAGAEKRGSGIGLDVLVRLAKAAGGRLSITWSRNNERR